MEAVEHADSERHHAEGFLEMARKNHLDTIVNMEGIYWKTMRQNFFTMQMKKILFPV